MRRLLILSLLGFCAGLAAAAWFSIPQAAAVFEPVRSATTSSAAPNSEASRAFSSREEILTAIMGAVTEEEPLLRAHRLHDLLSPLNAAELALLFEHAVRLDDYQQRRGLISAVLARWSVIDLTGASTLAKSYRVRLHAVPGMNWSVVTDEVQTAWAQIRPEESLAEALSDPDAKWAQRAAWTAIQVLTEGDLPKQLQMLARLPQSKLREQMCEEAIKTLAKKDGAAAEANLDLLSEPGRRARMQAKILGNLAERDPAAALARMAVAGSGLQAGVDGTWLVGSVFGAAAKQDPMAALAAVATMAEELQSQALGAALVGWAGKHPVEALEWAAANGVDINETKAVSINDFRLPMAVYDDLVDIAFRSDFKKTFDWVLSRPASSERDVMLNSVMWRGTLEQKLEGYSAVTPEERQDAASTIVASFNNQGPGPVEAWVKSLPPGEGRIGAVANLISLQYDAAPERIATLADEWPNVVDRNVALSGLANNIAYENPRRALDFARLMRPSTGRDAAFEHIATQWLNHDEAAARAWMASTRELSAEQKRVLLRQAEP